MIFGRSWKKGVPASQLGPITAMPGFGRRYVMLEGFKREGLASLGRGVKSAIFTNRRLAGAHRAGKGGESPDDRCFGCNRTMMELFGDAPENQPRNLELLWITSPDGRVQKRYCWDCASSRDQLIDFAGEAFAPCIAEDKKDIFALIEQIIADDRLADTPGYEALALHNNSFRPSPKYRLEIDGRRRTVLERMNR